MYLLQHFSKDRICGVLLKLNNKIKKTQQNQRACCFPTHYKTVFQSSSLTIVPQGGPYLYQYKKN